MAKDEIQSAAIDALNEQESAPGSMLDRAQGCLLGQLAGDALGSQVEFMDAAAIVSKYPDGVRELRDGGAWNTLAGQPTDDSEMALLLAKMLVRDGEYSAAAAFSQYQYWLSTDPFDVGGTIGSALRGSLSPTSQANGALMRVSPIGIFGAVLSLEEVARMARADAELTHPHPVCLEANALFTMAIASAINTATTPEALYADIVQWASDLRVPAELRQCIADASTGPPRDFVRQQGWLLIAFGNALYRLLQTACPAARSLEEAIVETVMAGGDTDTNAAIAGALLGAVHGRQAVPQRWIDCLRHCRPAQGLPNVHRPRPEVFWPVDCTELAEKLLRAGTARFAIAGKRASGSPFPRSAKQEDR